MVGGVLGYCAYLVRPARSRLFITPDSRRVKGYQLAILAQSPQDLLFFVDLDLCDPGSLSSTLYVGNNDSFPCVPELLPRIKSLEQLFVCVELFRKKLQRRRITQ